MSAEEATIIRNFLKWLKEKGWAICEWWGPGMIPELTRTWPLEREDESLIAEYLDAVKDNE